jgi:hypothetical protein
MSKVEFFFRLFVLDGGDGINNVETFIYDFAPMDRKSYPDEWVREHISCCWDEEWVRRNCKLPSLGDFQVVGKAELHGGWDPYPIEEWDEDSEILESKYISIPEGWWKWRCKSGSSLDEIEEINGYPMNETGP